VNAVSAAINRRLRRFTNLPGKRKDSRYGSPRH
jgi:hypothetical protein